MIIIGLSGNIAMGKSKVASTFKAECIPVVDADVVAREVVKPGSSGIQQISDFFGKEFLLEDGNLDRAKLGSLVFADASARLAIDVIMHPLITVEAARQFDELFYQGHQLICFDAPLIVERGNADKYRPLIIVHCPLVMQLERLMKRNSLSEREAMYRINSQWPIEEKIKLADYTIDTSRTIEESAEQTKIIIKELRKLIKF